MKIYELTTNGKDGYLKYLVRGIKDDKEGIKLAKLVFGKYAWTPGGVTHYADVGKDYGHGKIPSLSIKQFLKYKKHYKSIGG